jgi:hypothetical protein
MEVGSRRWANAMTVTAALVVVKSRWSGESVRPGVLGEITLPLTLRPLSNLLYRWCSPHSRPQSMDTTHPDVDVIHEGGSLPPDWGASVPIIPDGIINDISSHAVNTTGHYGDIYEGYHTVLALKVALKRPRNLSQNDVKVCRDQQPPRLSSHQRLPLALLPRGPYMDEVTATAASEHSAILRTCVGRCPNPPRITLHEQRNFG